MYNVSEKDDHCAFVHQDDSCSDTEHDVQEGDADEGMHNLQDDGEVPIVEGKLADLITTRKRPCKTVMMKWRKMTRYCSTAVTMAT